MEHHEIACQDDDDIIDSMTMHQVELDGSHQQAHEHCVDLTIEIAQLKDQMAACTARCKHDVWIARALGLFVAAAASGGAFFMALALANCQQQPSSP